MSLEIQKNQARTTRSMVRKAGHDHLVPKKVQKKLKTQNSEDNFTREDKKLLKRLAQENKEMCQKARTVKLKL